MTARIFIKLIGGLLLLLLMSLAAADYFAGEVSFNNWDSLAVSGNTFVEPDCVVPDWADATAVSATAAASVERRRLVIIRAFYCISL